MVSHASYEIATILPSHEYFTQSAAGAIALFVRDTTMNSAYHGQTRIYGRPMKSRPFSDITYTQVNSVFPRLLGRSNAYTRGLVQLIKQRRTGLIEVHNDIQIFKTLSSQFTNTPVTLYLHDDPLTLQGAKKPKERWAILSRADMIYCASDYVRRRFLTGLEAGRTEHVHVLYQGISIKPKPRKEAFILYVGHLTKEKGALELALAAQILLPHFPNWRIVFAGARRPSGNKNATSYAHAIEKVLRPLGKQAVFLGYQPHNKVLELFSRASIAVVPSLRNEASGRTALEAMAAGCALVTSGYGALAELAGDAAMVVTPVTAQGLALALQGLLEDPESLRGIRNTCQERGQGFTSETMHHYFDKLRHYLLAQAYGG